MNDAVTVRTVVNASLSEMPVRALADASVM